MQKKINALKKEQLLLIEKIKKIIDNNQFFRQSFLNILTIKGVCDITAIALLHLFIKYPNANQRQIVSLAGLEPTHQSSITSIDTKPKISKAGSKLYRSILFMNALSAIRFNPDIERFYNRLKEHGKQTIVVQVAVMRKLLVIAHSLFKNNQQYHIL